MTLVVASVTLHVRHIAINILSMYGGSACVLAQPQLAVPVRHPHDVSYLDVLQSCHFIIAVDACHTSRMEVIFPVKVQASHEYSSTEKVYT